MIDGDGEGEDDDGDGDDDDGDVAGGSVLISSSQLRLLVDAVHAAPPASCARLGQLLTDEVFEAVKELPDAQRLRLPLSADDDDDDDDDDGDGNDDGDESDGDPQPISGGSSALPVDDAWDEGVRLLCRLLLRLDLPAAGAVDSDADASDAAAASGGELLAWLDAELALALAQGAEGVAPHAQLHAALARLRPLLRPAEDAAATTADPAKEAALLERRSMRRLGGGGGRCGARGGGATARCGRRWRCAPPARRGPRTRGGCGRRPNGSRCVPSSLTRRST